MSIPAQFVAGDTVEFTDSYEDYPASDGWTLTYVLRGASSLNATGTADGDEWTVTFSANQTALLQPGRYEYAAFVSLDGERYTVANGRVDVRPNLITAMAGDKVSRLEKLVAVLDEAILGRYTDDMQSFSISGRNLTLIPISELRMHRGEYARELWRLKNPQGNPRKEYRFKFTTG